MSKDKQLALSVQNFKKMVEPANKKYSKTSLVFDKEQMFAAQQLSKNDYTKSIAENNRNSVLLAMYNAADIGITLNPVEKLGYLIPRDGQIVLEVGYLGLIYLAVRNGAIKRAKPYIVKENDFFELNGNNAPPSHKYNPFKPKERGETVGYYCISEMTDGSIYVDCISIEEANKARDESSAYKAWKSGRSANGGPWAKWPDDMGMKTLVRRCYKWWTKKSDYTDNRLFLAEKLAEDNGEMIDFNDKEEHEIDVTPQEQPKSAIEGLLEENGVVEETGEITNAE